ncbi:CinA family protein [Sphingobacterium corticibacterium]|uniref:Nicotinamide-nucleotide amidohydrolase family protein n=1 Tax=Sphingobacterium corticibacterium TaxID=2484746 RepID=A0A4Q6XQ37_9SPHI|nr:nicotinamide-nucleotide amidohydrolase family protein [Sphingobacterium corticibacterium]RZF62393.1 nicotinamide-nucleotide amidohydrolase family protein [Sphingobacterium corticibacterium]
MVDIIAKPVMQIDDEALAACGEFLQAHGLKLLCAESMTAGYLSSLWSLEFHSGDYFLGSLVCYDDQCKTQLLAVPKNKIEKYCAESAVITLRMLDGLTRTSITNADVFISITGLAFKTNNPKQKREIGTVYYAFRYQREKRIYKKKFSGDPSAILIQTCNSLFRDLITWLPRVTSKS